LLDAASRNEFFGFRCLHYSVSESVGTIKVEVENKTQKKSKVRVRTVDDQAVGGEDFEPVDELLEFRDGQKT